MINILGQKLEHKKDEGACDHCLLPQGMEQSRERELMSCLKANQWSQGRERIEDRHAITILRQQGLEQSREELSKS